MKTYRYRVTFEHGQKLDKTRRTKIALPCSNPSRRMCIIAILQAYTFACVRILAIERIGKKEGAK